uniref:Density-regulated protein homolog n=1 Tax=Daphnia magna TaxID=35525 RepID=A0A0P5T8T2_9CRUS
MASFSQTMPCIFHVLHKIHNTQLVAHSCHSIKLLMDILHLVLDQQARIGDGKNEGDESKETEDDKKRQKRGGKGLSKPKKKEGGPKKISLSVAPRGRKRLTCVVGLKSYDIDLKTAAKFFGTKFACGASVTGDDEIVIQGDVKDDLFDLLPEKWPQIDEDSIDDLGEVKR